MQRKMIEINAQIIGQVTLSHLVLIPQDFSVILPSRSFITDGTFVVLHSKKKHEEHIFLFSDSTRLLIPITLRGILFTEPLKDGHFVFKKMTIVDRCVELPGESLGITNKIFLAFQWQRSPRTSSILTLSKPWMEGRVCSHLQRQAGNLHVEVQRWKH